VTGPRSKKLTLSFDNGPNLEVTPQVLDTLARLEIKATFFVCGRDIAGAAARTLLARMRREGHRIGNHTYSHEVVLGRTNDPEAPEREIGRTQKLLEGFVDSDRLFRPYGGGGYIGDKLLSRRAVQYLCEGGYTCVLWSSVPRDWQEPLEWPERALSDIRAQDWTLVVLHDIRADAMQRLPRFVESVRDEGVGIVQDLPPDWVPIVRGEVVMPLDRWMSD
jgi:peptidoglycan/xylan/chitin deacetylase (PgdA/CDA1 family)